MKVITMINMIERKEQGLLLEHVSTLLLWMSTAVSGILIFSRFFV